MKVGITGSRTLSGDREHDVVRSVLASLDQGVTIVHGGCTGVDTFAGWYHRAIGDQVIVILPANARHTDALWLGDQHSMYVTTRQMPPSREPYKARNQSIVDECDRLIAFPRYPEDHPKSKRSGTWQTVRLARKAGKPVEIHILEP